MTFLLFTFLSSPATIAQTQPPKPPIQLGTSLFPNSTHASWLSPSGVFAFGFYPQGSSGFFVAIWLVDVKTVVWTANRDDPPVTSNARLQLTTDGKLVLSDGQGEEKVIANASAKASFASMLDSGNLVLYNKDSSIIWQSFDHPTDTLLMGQSLPAGDQLFSNSSRINHSTGRFRLKMQGDGNLVLYPANTTDTRRDAYWASGTVGTKHHLYLNHTGLLSFRNSSNFDLKFLNNDPSLDNDLHSGNQTIFRATLDFDGVFRLYAHVNNGSDKKICSWPEGNTCEVKGFCGFNSFCTFNDDNPECHCLAGFDFIDPSKETLGCKRNFAKAECRGENDSVAFYNMTSMYNILWEDHPYFKVVMSWEEECSFACLADCNCWGALYEGGTCKKQGLPLRYVRRIKGSDAYGDSTVVVFLKVGNNSLTNWKGNDKPVPKQPPPIKTTGNKAIGHIIVVTTVFALLLCASIGISSHYMYKIGVLRYKRLMETGILGLNEGGSFGAVYKGALNKGRRLVAVKRLEKLVEEGEREFQAEMRAIGKTHHRNLVRLLGFCAEGSKRLLVYEYMTNGSLGNLIFGAQRRLDWNDRVRIALEIARGILYLHEECEAPIIHCDIKPQNILMDEFSTAKISDFGLAKLLMPDQTRTFTGVRGTRGYVAPEWHKNIPISVKADVYSYGVVLLEILCCRRNIEVNVSVPEEVLLSNWAYKCFVTGQLNKLVLWEASDKNVLENMVKVALWCIQDEPVLRPTMKSVVLMLEGITDIAIPPCPNSNSM
ncbi:hypothetical protein RJT34_32543 [Clitoria ternatea]|uniref:Receptor-like serine/threonine-protein kinase n=1 Tax=Clitoria ternatea TaxID=43366 RepID=A0AAN9F0I4_CLITE